MLMLIPMDLRCAEKSEPNWTRELAGLIHEVRVGISCSQ